MARILLRFLGMSKRVGYAVATLVGGILISEIFDDRVVADDLVKRLGCRLYLAVEVRR